jgi:hypothetical protein
MKEPRHLPEIPLSPSPTTDEARTAMGFKWAHERVGRRHKLGGAPEWLQGTAVPTCSDCREAMTFYGQLDSVGDGIVLADLGMIYVFVCFDCFTTKSVLQSG